MTLAREMHAVLIEMMMLGSGRTQAFNSSGGKSESPDPRPSGEAHPLAEKWHDAWKKRPTRDTLDAARAELDAWKKRTAPADGDGSGFEDWVVEDGEGFAVAQVASKFGIPRARVVRIRLRAKNPQREAEFGMPVEMVTRAQVQTRSRERVLELARQGITPRQVETITEVPRETVRRWMKEAA